MENGTYEKCRFHFPMAEGWRIRRKVVRPSTLSSTEAAQGDSRRRSNSWRFFSVRVSRPINRLCSWRRWSVAAAGSPIDLFSTRAGGVGLIFQPWSSL